MLVLNVVIVELNRGYAVFFTGGTGWGRVGKTSIAALTAVKFGGRIAQKIEDGLRDNRFVVVALSEALGESGYSRVPDLTAG